MEEENKGKISIIIPTYNRSNYVKRAVESVLDQSYENTEIIVIDDASVDDTRETIESIKDKRIKYIRNKENKGANFSRNKGIKKSTGKYISFLDDDDFFSDKNKLKKQVELFLKNKNVVFVGCGYYDKSIDKERYPKIKGKISEKLLMNFSDIETSTILIDKKTVEKIGLFDEKLPSEQNHDFFYRISKKGEFDYLDKVMVNKDNPETQISSTSKNKILGYLLFHKKHFKDMKKLGYKKLLQLTLKFMLVSFLFSTSIFFKNNLKATQKLDEIIKSKND